MWCVCVCGGSSVLRCSLYNVECVILSVHTEIEIYAYILWYCCYVVVASVCVCASVVQITINDKSKSNESAHEIKSVLTMAEVTNRMFLIYTISNIMFFFSPLSYIFIPIIESYLITIRENVFGLKISDIKRYSPIGHIRISQFNNHKMNVFYMRLFAAKSTICT